MPYPIPHGNNNNLNHNINSNTRPHLSPSLSFLERGLKKISHRLVLKREHPKDTI